MKNAFKNSILDIQSQIVTRIIITIILLFEYWDASKLKIKKFIRHEIKNFKIF